MASDLEGGSADMLRRRVERRRVARSASMIIAGEPKPVPCVVLDVSPMGARLHVHGGRTLPAVFRLLIDQDGLLRNCALAWHDDDQAGVQFTD